jgi:LysM repeat protein
MKFFPRPGWILTLALLFLLQACSPVDSDSPAPASPLSVMTPTAEPTPAPWVFPLATSASLALITPTPAVDFVAPPLATPTPFPYTVSQGDTLGQIALRYGLTVDEIIAANPGLNAQILSIGQQIQIPPRAETSDFANPAPAELVAGPLRCIPSGEGMWCLAALTNPHNEPVENVIAQLTLFSAAGLPLDSQEATLPLNILPAGASLPLAAFFPVRPAEPFSIHLDILTAMLLSPGDGRYLPARVDNLLVQVSADGLSATVNGRIFLPEGNPPAVELWLAGVVYDKGGQMIGFRRWQSATLLAEGEIQTFSFNIYSLDGAIDRLEVHLEARP